MTTPGVIVFICKAAYDNGDGAPPEVAWSYMFALYMPNPDATGGYRQVLPRRQITIMAPPRAYDIDRAYQLTPATDAYQPALDGLNA